MANIKTILGTDTVSLSRITLNENFASINQQLNEFSQLFDGFEGGFGGSFNGEVTTNIIPNQNEVYDLGSETNRFRDLYLSNNTIYLGNNSISMSGNNMMINGRRLVTDNRLLEEVAERARLLGIETNARTQAISNVTNQISSLADSTSAMAQTLTNLNTTFEAEIATAIGDERLARIEAVSDINQTLTSLSNVNQAIAQSVTDLGTSFTSEITDALGEEAAARTEAISNINQTLTSLSNDSEAIAESITNLNSSFITEIANAVDAEKSLRTEAISSINQTLTTLNDGNSALAESVTTLEAQYTIEDGSITGFSQASALKTAIDSAIATANEATVISTTELIAELGDQTATVTETMTANIDALTNKVNAQYTIEVDANGNVAGIKLGADETGSSIAFTADSFKVSTGGPQGQILTPFSIIDGKVAFNGAVSFSEGPQGATGPQGTPGTNGLDGSDGLPGAPGADGVSTYFHVAYADTAIGGGFSQSPEGKLYIGTYVDSTLSDALAGSSLWKWQLVKGADGVDGENGIPGTNGTDGKTTYLHIAYANNSTGTSGFSTTDSNSKTYLGTYTDFTLADSTNPALYKWTLIKGSDGLNGTNGLPGAPGADGVSTYFHVAYADTSSGGGFSQNATGKLYIGTYVDNTQADAPAGSSLWKWQLVKGADGLNGSNGIPGTNGVNGQTSYLHIAYANNASGTSGFSTSDSTNKLYLGTYTDFTEADSSNPALYTWALIKGADGAQGPQGPAPDTSTYLTTSTSINGGQITTGIIKNGNFVAANPNWDTYSNSGMGINLDKGAINSKNFYIDAAGNAKFRGDIDSDGATIKGSPMTDLFVVEPALDEFDVYRPVLKMRGDIYIGESRFTNFSEDLRTVSSNFGTFRDEYNTRMEQSIQTTLSHVYIKRNDTQLEVGDLVKLDENNELVKASTAKDPAIIGILWEEAIFSITHDDSEKPHHYRDSLGNQIPTEDRDQKGIWRVASLGDSVDVNSGLQGMKICNQNGPVLRGDLLCSSDIPGYAMKQPVEYAIIGFDNGVPQYEERQIVTSYTLGKCMEDCIFDSEGKATGIYGYIYCG